MIDIKSIQQQVSQAIKNKSRKSLDFSLCDIVYKPKLNMAGGTIRLSEIFVDSQGLGTISYLRSKGVLSQVGEYIDIEVLQKHSNSLIIGFTNDRTIGVGIMKKDSRSIISKDHSSPSPIDWNYVPNYSHSLAMMVKTIMPSLDIEMVDTIGFRLSHTNKEALLCFSKKGDHIIPFQITGNELVSMYVPFELYVRFKNKTQEVLTIKSNNGSIVTPF